MFVKLVLDIIPMAAISEALHSKAVVNFPEGNHKLGVGGRVYQEGSENTKLYTVVSTNISETEEKSRTDILYNGEEIIPEVWIIPKNADGFTDRMRLSPNKDLLEILHCNGAEIPACYFLVSESKPIQLLLGMEVPISIIETDPDTLDKITNSFSALQTGLQHGGIGVASLNNFANIPASVNS